MKKIISLLVVLFLSTSYITPMLTLSGKCKSVTRITNHVAFSVLKDSQEPKKGEIFRHYKGKKYVILGVGHDSEDPTMLRVMYQGLYKCPTFGKKPLWVRPLAMFQEHVLVDGKKVERFKKVDPLDIDHVDVSLWLTFSDSFSD